ncbi:hypothetical protein COLO4_29887 [Corchorus olitorius]|uniref:CTLH domain-containing protein n=1 Tax=Corchorus olitorius TaxID=93759 RepID=A0A1R3HCV1_9ROSI|nr:hypothetical protein COLO4_29887 [Corchorus olitorius]
MGGVEDDEPATKRMKLTSEELRRLSNGTSKEPVAGSSRDLMARPLQSDGGDEVVGSKGVIKKVEFVRIIAKALYSLGYVKSGAHLEEESGIPLYSSLVNVFMRQILEGNWDGSVVTLRGIGLTDEKAIKSASFLILEQKFFELLHEEKVMDALKTLRTEIAPLSINHSRVRELSSCIVSPSNFFSVRSPKQDISRARSRTKLLEELQKLLPPAVMVPERRLEHLVEQALVLQRDACMFHNSLDKEMSLYSDHQCGRDQIPCQTLQILQDHTDEVWFLQFSHNGKYLASSSSDRSAIIWEVDANGVSLKHKLSGHQKPVSSVSWSPDDRQLLTCGVEEVVRRWDVSSGECLHVYEKAGLGHKRTRFIIRSCFGGLEQAFIASGSEDSLVYIWHRATGELIEALPGHSGAVNCISWNPTNPHMLASASDDRTIRIWGLNKLSSPKLKETHSNGVHYCNGGT